MSAGGLFHIGQKVRWAARQSWFEGIVTAVIPEGVVPKLKLHQSTKPRDHVSYLVTARRLNSRAQQHGPTAERWPQAELLRRI